MNDTTKIINNSTESLDIISMNDIILYIIYIIVTIIVIYVILDKILFKLYEAKIKVENFDKVYKILVIISISLTAACLLFFNLYKNTMPPILNAIFILFSSTIVFTLKLYFEDVQKKRKKQDEIDKGHKYIHHAININLKQCERHIEYWEFNKEHEDVDFNYEIWNNVHEFILKLDMDSGLISELLKIQEKCKILNKMENELKKAKKCGENIDPDKIKKQIYFFIDRMDKILKKYYKDSYLNAETYFNRGTFSYTIKNYKEAIEYFDKSLQFGHETNYKYTHALTMKGTNLDRLGKYKEAIKCYDEAMVIEPENDYPHINKASALNKMGKFDESIRCCKNVLDIDSKNDIAINTMGYALYGKEKYEEAIKCHKKALKLNSEKIYAYFGIADSLCKCAKYKEAIEYYDKILAIEPKNIYALNSKGNSLFCLEKYIDALKLYESTVKINPKMIKNLIKKAKYLRDLGNKYKEASKYDNKIQELDPENKYPK
jgi:tetratricopeptide (TPR) repeat protein